MGTIVDPSQAPADANAAPMSNSDKFGLFGLLNIIRNTDPDANALALGTDLTTLGLNLNSADPEYHLPACYSVQLPPTAAGAKGIAAKLASFSDETLFYLFYAQPRDAAQELAAQELWSRHWRFNRAAQVWLTKDPSVDPVAKTAQYERGTFVVFDVATWQKTRKELTLYYEQLEERAGNPPGYRPWP
ncbi:hypothetical protein BCR44DRAFT_1479461 [Catenaria anguillulae PL171]|uniref:NOT2/NOT3/NOT5 C-terminal domain-containing protein n=1 Tax=Catenaria anguillulae PL171 TaxID=765915 RepID=A0A1Y2HRI0_9FUNG|nr:hypothetical protein BCR44DRAFT_1479461 [Catenaria anguillulae PL171]